MKSLLLTISFVFMGLTSLPTVEKTEVGDPEACWALADHVENLFNGGRGAQYESYGLWDFVYNSCLNDFRDY